MPVPSPACGGINYGNAVVSPNYVGLPSMAGRGKDERGRKPTGSGGRRGRRPTPEARSRGHKTPPWSAGRRLAPRTGARAARRRLKTTAPFGAPPPRFRGHRKKARPAPLNSRGLAQPYPKSRSRKILPAQASRPFDFNPCGRKTGARCDESVGVSMQRGFRCGRPLCYSALCWPVAAAAT